MNARLKGRLAHITLAIAAVMLLAGIMPQPSAAADETGIAVQGKVGLNGSYKETKWYPLRLTMTNGTGRDLSGEAVLSVANPDGSTSDYVVQVDLPSGTPVDFTIGLPGNSLNTSNNKLRFYEGSHKGGKSIQLDGATAFTGSRLSGYAIGVLSRDPDTMNFMPTLNLKGYDITVLPMQPMELPEETVMLDALDTLVINDISTQEWSGDVVQAIKEWVARGGTLVLSGGAGYSKTAAAFTDIAPLQASGTTTIETAESLAGSSGEPLVLSSPLTLSSGQLTEGAKAVLREEAVIVAAKRDYGFGTVVYAAFDPSLEPLATWKGSAPLWSKLLHHNLSNMQGMTGVFLPSPTYNNNLMWSLSHLIDLFPSIKPPAFGLLLGMFAMYVLLVAPLLYIVLAKLDRREWGWWMIPSLSVLMGVLVFVIGAGDKRSSAVHTIEIVEVASDGQAIISGATAIFSPNGGTVTADFEQKLPLRHNANVMTGNAGSPNMNGEYQFHDDGSGLQAVWREVPYWSTRKLWMDRRVADPAETGSIAIAYEGDSGARKLVVTNDTKTDLTHVTLIADGTIHAIGALKQGESGSVAMPSLTSNPQPGHYFSYGHMIFPYSGSYGHNVHERERQMTDNYFNDGNSGLFPMNPSVVAYSTDNTSLYDVDGRAVKSDRLTMWVKRLDTIERTGGRVNVPASAMQPIVMSSTMAHMESYGNGVIQVSPGELVLEYAAPDFENVAYDKLDLQMNMNVGNMGMQWSIWRAATEEWVPLGGATDSPNEYMTDSGIIRMKLVSSMDGQTMFPYISLEGEELVP
ncbi:hypothetical protein [Paenibacillus sp. PL2-23]|uniref:hypothetical protein n=1 Tax=Paenibacillus sp. PL2-23 TaxID=2100729 RepID=UPI0030FC2019